jgi:hypothetical protein
MAHFARINENNIVEEVIVVSNDDCAGGSFPESETIGQSFIGSIGISGNWKQTSYNGNFRKRYAGKGDTYNSELDAFISPKPYPSWTLNSETADWDAPLPKPETGNYFWNEDAQQWDEIA